MTLHYASRMPENSLADTRGWVLTLPRPPVLGNSVRPPAADHLRNGAQQDLPIERERPVVDVFHVEPHPGLEIHRVAAGDGPQAGAAGAHAQPAPVPALILVDFLRDGGPRADQRHVALQNVPELRPFV